MNANQAALIEMVDDDVSELVPSDEGNPVNTCDGFGAVLLVAVIAAYREARVLPPRLRFLKLRFLTDTTDESGYVLTALRHVISPFVNLRTRTHSSLPRG